MGEADRVEVPFERRHFDCEVVALCVRWYLSGHHSLRELVGMMADRGLPVAHTTLMRWTRRCTARSTPGQRQSNGSPKRSWRVEESRIRIRGTWRHLHRAVDARGETVDFWLGDEHDAAAAESFFRRASGTTASNGRN